MGDVAGLMGGLVWEENWNGNGEQEDVTIDNC